MQPSRKLTKTFMAFAAILLLTAVARAGDPGVPYPSDSQVTDQKAGSLLIYNIYTSGATGAGAQNTRFNITNTHVRFSIFVHIFLVDGNTCSIADFYTCLTANQTSTALASEIDPGVTGYLVAVSVNRNGLPINFNFLIGDEFVKFVTGHFANLGAEAFAAVGEAEAIPGVDEASGTALLPFTGLPGNYNLVPAVLALDNIPSRADGNSTLLIVNRIGGNLAIGASTLGALFGILYDDSENAHSFTFTGSCQLRGELSNVFPRTVPRFELVIPAGSTGWMKIFNSTAAIGILGASINFNANAGAAAGAFNSGHNLHKLKLTTASYTIPVFPPTC